MKRLEYMTELRKYLVDGGLGAEEINDAMQFYEELFLDAGVANEEVTSKNLGSPEDLARQILIDNDIHPDGEAKYVMDEAVTPQNNGAQYNPQFNNPQYNNPPVDNTKRLLLIIIIVLTAFIWGPILIGIFSAVFGIAIGIIATIFAFGVAGVGMTVGGIACLFSIPPVGVALIGAGFLFMGLCALIMIPFVKFIWRMLVKLFNWVVGVIRKFLGVRTVNNNG